jgi:hypothetical protein
VVISIIALLLAILVPALGKARELARQIVCGNHLKTLTTASITYAASYDGFYVPCGYRGIDPDQQAAGVDPGTDGLWSIKWMENKTFRKYVQMDDYITVGDSDFAAPKKFICPSDKISKKSENVTAGVLTSYGYNLTEWDSTSWPDGIFGPDTPWKGFVGHRIDAVKQPAEKLHFVDGIDWWVSWRYADYRRGWNKYGQMKISKYADLGVHGPVFYRHNESHPTGFNGQWTERPANVEYAIAGFYDGHAQRMHKEEIYIPNNFNPPSGDSKPGMWTARTSRYNGPTWQPAYR